MATEYIEVLQAEILGDLKTELQGDAMFDVAKLTVKIKDAIRRVRSARKYENTSYSEEKIYKDLSDNYYTVIKDLALYYWNKTGAEFEASISENDVSRTYISENEILGNVPAFVKIF
jgi:hypothetical protein